MAVRLRPSSGEIIMPLEDFRKADYGKLCAHLGLRPSQPDRRADGSRAPRRRGKRGRS